MLVCPPGVRMGETGEAIEQTRSRRALVRFEAVRNEFGNDLTIAADVDGAAALGLVQHSRGVVPQVVLATDRRCVPVLIESACPAPAVTVSGATTTLFGISATLSTGSIEIDTELAERWTPHRNLKQRLQVADAVRHYLLSHDADLTLPFDLRIESEDRLVHVDGIERTFHGMRIAGDTRWSGTCEIDQRHVTVTATGPATVEAIETTDATDLNDNPPPRPS
jgi:hypothetical protein